MNVCTTLYEFIIVDCRHEQFIYLYVVGDQLPCYWFGVSTTYCSVNVSRTGKYTSIDCSLVINDYITRSSILLRRVCEKTNGSF